MATERTINGKAFRLLQAGIPYRAEANRISDDLEHAVALGTERRFTEVAVVKVNERRYDIYVYGGTE